VSLPDEPGASLHRGFLPAGDRRPGRPSTRLARRLDYERAPPHSTTGASHKTATSISAIISRFAHSPARTICGTETRPLP